MKNTNISTPTFLAHYGIEGMKWGVRRYQNVDGSLTAAGEDRYSKSLTKLYNADSNDDYTISKGSSVFRRTSSNADDDYTNSKYTYTYDYDNVNDDNFYRQFGTKVSEYTLDDDIRLAGKKTLGKVFVEKMLTLEDENDIEAMDALYYDSRKRLGEDYVEDLFTLPYEPDKHIDALEKAGADMIAKMLSTQRHESNDEKMKRRGLRDYDTAANDLGRDIVDKLLTNGYSGMRDYNDYGSNANVNTPTVIFDPTNRIKKSTSWIDDL